MNTIFWFTPLIVFAVLKLLVPIQGFRNLMTRWIMAMGENWVSCNSWIFDQGSSTRWDVRGLEGLERKSWYLVVANHQTWVDIVALQRHLNRRIPFLKFFIKQELIWFPFLGVAWWAMDMPFMKRYSKSYIAANLGKKGKDIEATRRACEKFRHAPTSVIVFVEGTRFSEQKRLARESPYTHLLPARAGGIALSLASMGDMFDAILDVTIVYPTGVTQFWDMLCGELDHVIIDVRKRTLEPWLAEGDYAGDREFRRDFHRWLAAMWQEKDENIARLKREASPM